MEGFIEEKQINSVFKQFHHSSFLFCYPFVLFFFFFKEKEKDQDKRKSLTLFLSSINQC